MPWSSTGLLKVIWWNTSLAPPVNVRSATADDLVFVVDYVRFLRHQVGFDLLALAEVNAEDLRTILQGLNDPSLRVHDSSDRRSSLKFDTGVIYDSTKVTLEESRTLTDKFHSTTMKTGHQMIYRVTATGDPLFLITSHWPSKRTAPDGAPRRAELGTALRHRIQAIHEDTPEAFVILAGDYNDDPYADSLAEHLGATRDRTMAKRRKGLLYNPFWRKMGESHDDDHDDNNMRFCGTYYYDGGQINRWHTFDQIIFSSSFLTDKSMRLDERRCGVIATEVLWSKVLKSNQIFDHLPVFGTVELRSQA